MATLFRTLKADWSISATVAGFLAVLISYSGPLIIFSVRHNRLMFLVP